MLVFVPNTCASDYYLWTLYITYTSIETWTVCYRYHDWKKI